MPDRPIVLKSPFLLPVTHQTYHNTSVNPTRSISQALFVGDRALSRLWLFILIPITGAALTGLQIL